MKKTNYTGILISLILSTLLIVLIVMTSSLKGVELCNKIGIPIIRMLFFILLGLIIGEVIEATGWTKYLAVIARPIFRFSNLSDRCGAAFTIAFFSGVGANAMLYNFYKDGKITKKEIILSNIMNQLPAFFLHLPSTLFIILPLTKMVGAVYLMLVFAAILLRIFIVAIYGHFFLKPRKKTSIKEIEDDVIEKKFSTQQNILKRLIKRVPPRILNIVKFVFPIFLGVYFLKDLGVFDGLRNFLSSTFIGKIIPVESLSMVVISFIADYTSGFVTAGALLSHGILGFKQGVISILMGNIIAIPIRALRHQLPRFLGIYSPSLGAQVLLIGQLVRAISLIVVGVVYFLLF